MSKNIVKKILEHKGFIISLFFLFSIRWSLADHYRVPSGSMLPTIQIGDHVFVNKMAYDLKLPFSDIILATMSSPQRGDIIVFKYPKDPSINYVKRLVGVPGDRIEIQDGFIFVNGKTTMARPEMLTSMARELLTSREEFEYREKIGNKKFTVKRIPAYFRNNKLSFTVPKNQLFFMGDNRDNSSDGRSWGFVPRDDIKGKVKNVTMSVSLDGIIPNIKISRFGKALI